MSTVYTESVLKADVRYKVQEVSKFPKDKRYLIGTSVIFKNVIGSTAQIRATGGNMMEIPIRSIVDVKGFTAKGVQAKNADGFVVVAQNTLKIDVGTAYLSPTGVTDTHAVFDIKGKVIKLPLDILASLVRDKLVITKEVKKIAKKTGIDPEVINLLDQPELRQKLERVPSAIVKLLPHVNMKDIEDILYNKDEVYSDYLGEPHSSLAEVDKANVIIHARIKEEYLLELVQLNLKNEFEAIRLDELEERNK